MLELFGKRSVAIFSAILLTAISGSLIADECCYEPVECNKMYVGAFGGGLYSDQSKITQMGTAFFEEAVGGPLAVDARGHSKKRSTGFGGVQLGYEWSGRSFMNCCDWSLSPALEIEAFWYSHKRKGCLSNTTDLDRLPEHDFVDSFSTNAGVYLANAVFSLNNNWGVLPYLGLGVGATRISVNNANSLQVNPPERGINHFNSRRNDSSWAFAAQVKVGLRYQICESFQIFGEYRYLYVDSSNYILGSTVYPNHAHTSPWNVKFHNSHYNAFAFGVRYEL